MKHASQAIDVANRIVGGFHIIYINHLWSHKPGVPQRQYK